MTIDLDAGERIDRRARALHAEALAQVPGRTLLQLQGRRTRAGQAVARPRTLAWGLGAAFAAMFAIAVGLRPGAQVTAPQTAGVAAADPAAAAGEAGATDGLQDAFLALEEDPDFYLWLASADAQPLAME